MRYIGSGHGLREDPLTLSLSPRGERTLEHPLRIILGFLLPVRTRLRVRQQKMQARQGVLARRRTG